MADDEILKELQIDYLNRDKTILQNIRDKFNCDEKSARGRMRELLVDFQYFALMAETDMKNILKHNAEIDDFSGKVTYLNFNKAWNNAVKQQYELFKEYYLWTSDQNAFVDFKRQ